MATIAIDQSILQVVATATDDRVIRAIEGTRSGNMTINFRTIGPTLVATVRSVTWKGKKKPVAEEHEYAVTLAPHLAECSCPDYEYRHVICKHVVATVMALQGAENEQQQAA